MLAVKNILPRQLIPLSSNSDVVCIRLNSMTCCISYNPPNSSSANCNYLLNCVSNISNSSDRLVLLGDFNFPDINWDTLSGNSPVSNHLCDLIFSSGLSQLIVELTHIHGNVLGLILTNIEENIHSLEVHLSLSLSFDHYDITFTIVTIHKPPFKSKLCYLFNYSKGDYSGLSNHPLYTDFTTCF